MDRARMIVKRGEIGEGLGPVRRDGATDGRLVPPPPSAGLSKVMRPSGPINTRDKAKTVTAVAPSCLRE
jgi:hypothetical protein